MRASRLRLVVAATAGMCAAFPAVGEQFSNSPYTASYPKAPPCDVSFTTANFASMRHLLRDDSKYVYCFAPGDYRANGEIDLYTSGTSARRRYLRLDWDDGLRNASQRSQRAIVESVRIEGDWWVIQQLTIQPKSSATTQYLAVTGGDHDVLEGNLVDGIDQINAGSVEAVMLNGLNGDPATYDSVQGNLIRNGNMARKPVDFTGVQVAPATLAGENNDWNRVVDNEIVDWGDGVALGGYTQDCSEPGVQHATVIDGNDIYLTALKRANCATGAQDPNGECACAENGIDTKADPGPNPDLYTRITNNRVWGYRPTVSPVSCGGSGSNGQAISSGNQCPGHTVVADNVVSDSTTGISVVGKSWIVAGNLVYGIRATTGWRYGSFALLADRLGSGHRIEFNALVDDDTAFDGGSSDTLTACNVTVNDRGWAGLQPQGANHVTAYNYLYDGSTANFPGSSNATFANAWQSIDGEYCYWRKRWSGPERVCVPNASTTAASPHVATLAVCDPKGLVAAYGLAPVSWPTSTPCNDGVDNDGDGQADLGADIGCATPSSREDPECQNGIDDDGDGKIDFDGGASVNGGVPLAPPDPDCKTPTQSRESGGACGLGFEVGVALALLGRRFRQIA